MPHFLFAGSPEASASSVFIPVAARCSGSPQQRAPVEERPVRQTSAQKQAQDQEDAETHHQPGRLSVLLESRQLSAVCVRSRNVPYILII